MRVGRRSSCPRVVATPGAGRSSASLPRSSKTRRASANPLLWSPLEGRPITTSPGADRAAVDQTPALDDADREPGEIVLALGVEGRHLGGLAADETASRHATPARDAAHEIGAAPYVEAAGCEVVEEEQRLGADRQEVVHAHRDEVDADGVVAIERERDPELRADAVGRGHEQRLAVAARQPRQRGEPAHACDDLGSARAACERTNAVDQAIARGDVDASGGVRQGADGIRHRGG